MVQPANPSNFLYLTFAYLTMEVNRVNESRHSIPEEILLHPNWARQVALEEEMCNIGYHRIQKMIDGIPPDLKPQPLSRQPGGVHALRWAIDPYSQKIRDFILEAFSGKAGRRHGAATKLQPIPPDVAAFIALRTVLNRMIGVSLSVQQVGVKVGRELENEERLKSWHAQNPALFDTIHRDHKERGIQVDYTARVLGNRMRKAGAKWEPWTEDDCLHVGEKLIELLLKVQYPLVHGEMGPLLDLQPMAGNRKRKHKAMYRLQFTENADLMFDHRADLAALFTPGWLPTLVPPRPWTSPQHGAYWTQAVDYRARRMVKTENQNYLEDLRHVEMPMVYQTLNALQNTAWKINRKVYEVLAEAWEKQLPICELPPRDLKPLPTKPADIKTNETAKRLWKRHASATHEANHRMYSRRAQLVETLTIAKKMLDEAAIYFPYQLDFRSRIYAMPVFQNPQGPDYAKAMVTFAEGKPITNREAEGWLAIHGANCYGFDKVSLEDRIEWTLNHSEEIIAVAEDWRAERWWTDAEQPWQFLAFCFEWAEYCQVGAGFVSSLPISLDGTCNGLQHFSAMLRDPIGGKAVNLVPADRPHDIYQRVAEETIARLRLETDPMADQWLAYGIDRKLTKRPVMILPYGGTQYACQKYITDYVEDAGKPHPWGDKLMQAVIYLTRIIWKAIGDVVDAAQEAMKWLTQIARLMAERQLPIIWTTPAGFPVRQAYPELESRRVKLTLGDGIVYKRRLVTETDRINVDEQISGLPPNFVHSLDAAALIGCVIDATAQGITSFCMVHDSYGTTAAQTATLGRALRGAFVRMYQQHDTLGELRERVVEALGSDKDVPALPKTGNLNISDVLNSRFFFA